MKNSETSRRAAKMLRMLVLVCTVVGALGTAEVSAQLFWADAGSGDTATLTPLGLTPADTRRIQTAALDGSGRVDILTGLTVPSGFALDFAGGHMYWGQSGSGVLINRSNLDGTGVIPLVTSTNNLYGVDLDIAGGKIYWAETDFGPNPDVGTIWRADLDGTGAELLHTQNGFTPMVAVDPTNSLVYWTNNTSGTISHGASDGTGAVTVDRTATKPFGLVLDVAGGSMYWTESNGASNSKIRSALLDGTGGMNDLVTEADIDMGGPFGIDLDLLASKIYWTDNAKDGVYVADLDGSSPAQLIDVSDMYNASPRFIQVVPIPEPSSAVLLGLGSMVLLWTRRKRKQD